jgi:ribosomal protein S18 acetylase RimI-like enzyme
VAILEGVDICLYPTPDTFRHVVRAVYDRDPVLFTLELTTLRARDWPAGQILLSVDDGGVVGAAVQSADGVLLVSGMYSDWARGAVSALADSAHPVTGIRGMPLVAAAFAQAWGDITGMPAVAAHQEVLYRLDTLIPPVGVRGDCRLAGEGDTDLLVDWLHGFFAEAFGAQPDHDAHRVFLREVATSDDCIVLWTAGGEAVSMARLHAPSAGVSRIGPVYTPPVHRGHGYAAAVTARAVIRADELQTTDVVLFADVANLVSSRVYRRIGFRPFSEHVHYARQH